MFRVQRVDPRQREKLVEEENSLSTKKKKKKNFQTDGWQLGLLEIQKPDSGSKIPLKSNLK